MHLLSAGGAVVPLFAQRSSETCKVTLSYHPPFFSPAPNTFFFAIVSTTKSDETGRRESCQPISPCPSDLSSFFYHSLLVHSIPLDSDEDGLNPIAHLYWLPHLLLDVQVDLPMLV